MKRVAVLFVAVLFALGLTGPASAGEPKKDAPAAKEATTVEKDNTVKTEKKTGTEGKKDDAKPKKRKKESSGC